MYRRPQSSPVPRDDAESLRMIYCCFAGVVAFMYTQHSINRLLVELSNTAGLDVPKFMYPDDPLNDTAVFEPEGAFVTREAPP